MVVRATYVSTLVDLILLYLRVIARFLGVAIGSPSADSLLMPIALTVDNQVSVRELVKLLIRSENWKPETFEPAQKFLLSWQ